MSVRKLGLLLGLAVVPLASCTSAGPGGPADPNPSSVPSRAAARATGAPLGEPDPPATVCMPYRGHPITFTGATFAVSGTSPVTIENVRFRGLSGLKVSGSFIVRHASTSVGYWPVYPPPRTQLQHSGVDWRSEVSVRGARLPSSAAGDSYDLVLGLTATDAAAKYDGLDIAYVADGRQYTYTATLAAKLETPPRTCT